MHKATKNAALSKYIRSKVLGENERTTGMVFGKAQIISMMDKQAQTAHNGQNRRINLCKDYLCNMSRKQIYGLIFGLLLLPVLSWGQGRFYTQISDQSISTDEDLEVRFIIENPQGAVSNFKPPLFQGFRVLSGPSTMSNIEIINGQKREQRAYIYTLQARQTGILTIGSATVKIGKVTVQTRPVQVKVTDTPSKPSAHLTDQAPYLLRREAQPDTAYTGQQISLDLLLYDRGEVNVQSYNLLREPEFSGFFTTSLRNYRKGARQVQINDQTYTLFTLRRTALFAQQAGEYLIEPVIARINILDENQRRKQNFFFRPRLKNIDLRSDSLLLYIKPLPHPLPAHFSGGVGRYTFEAQLDKKQLSTDEVCHLQVRIFGNGDPKRFHFQLPKLSDSLEIYEPKTLDQRSYENGGQLWHTETLEYTIRPKYPGNYVLPVELVYFDTDSAQYRSIKSPDLRLAVSQGTKIQSDETAEEAANQLPPFIPAKKLPAKPQKAWIEQKWYLPVLLFPFLLLGLSLLYEQLKPEGPGEEEKARLRAMAFAERQIQEAGQLLAQNQERAYYETLYLALQAYLHRRMNLPVSELSSRHLAKAAHDKLPEELLKRWQQLLEQTEQALFAGRQTEQLARATHETAKQLIADTEKALKEH